MFRLCEMKLRISNFASG